MTDDELTKEIEDYIKSGDFQPDDYCDARADFGLELLRQGRQRDYNRVPEIFLDFWNAYVKKPESNENSERAGIVNSLIKKLKKYI